VHILKRQKDLKSFSNATSQTPRKTRVSKTQNKQKREIIKISAKINEIERTTKKYTKNQWNKKLVL
jgi:hypothetical protein